MAMATTTSPPAFRAPTTPSTCDWANFRPLIIRLYKANSLNHVRAYLCSTHNFKATPRMYKRRLAEWGVLKNVRKRDIPLYKTAYANYRATHNRSPTTLYVNGSFIHADKVKRSLKRHDRRVRKNSNESSDSSQDAWEDVDDDEPEAPSDMDSNDSTAVEDCSLHLTPSSYTAGSDKSTEGPCGAVVGLTSKNSCGMGDMASGELSEVSILILQTDFHWGELRVAASFRGDFRAFNSSESGLKCTQPAPYVSPTMSTVKQSGEMLDLESIFYQSNRYFENMPAKMRPLTRDRYQCSSIEATQAHDFYGRHWLGMMLCAGARPNLPLAWSLFDGVWAQTGQVLREHHPHFLPWICFVICYPRDWVSNYKEADLLQARTLSYAQWMTESVSGRDDPRFIIQQKLQRSYHQRDFALALLRQIVNRFLSDTQHNYVQDLQVLAGLLRHVDQVAHLDAAQVEDTLKNWARGSLGVAERIHRKELAGVYNRRSSSMAE